MEADIKLTALLKQRERSVPEEWERVAGEKRERKAGESIEKRKDRRDGIFFTSVRSCGKEFLNQVRI